MMVQIAQATWVNPTQVVSVRTYHNNRVIVRLTTGTDMVWEKSNHTEAGALVEKISAILNGSEEEPIL